MVEENGQNRLDSAVTATYDHNIHLLPAKIDQCIVYILGILHCVLKNFGMFTQYLHYGRSPLPIFSAQGVDEHSDARSLI